MSSIMMLLLMVLLLGTGWCQNCSRGSMCLEAMQKMRIEEIKHTILNELGLPSPPQLDKSKMPSAAMRREYQRMAEQELLESDIEQQMEGVLLAAEDPWNGEDASSLIAWFNLEGQGMNNYDLHGAILTFFVRWDNPTGRQTKVEVQVFEKDLNKEIGDLLVTDEQWISSSQRISVKLSRDEIARWFATDASRSQGVFVSARIGGHNLAVHPQQTDSDHENMILQVSITPKNRKKRHATAVCDSSSKATTCCLYDLIVDFQTIQWDWIISPPSYNAYVCRGGCEFNDDEAYGMGDYAHNKIVKAAQRMGDETNEVIGISSSCCHPTDYEHIKLVYLNRDNRVSIANVKGMIAKRCACS